MPTYPGSPTLTVDALLKQPRLIARGLTELTYKRFVADRVFSHGSSEQVAGGAATYQKSESIFMDRDPEEVGVRAEFPRAGWTEELFQAFVHTYGLETPISFLNIRRNQLDQVSRGQRKLSNSLVRFVDTIAMTLLLDTTGQGISTGAASGDWTTAATDIAFDIAKAKQVIINEDEGYEPNTMIVNPAQELDILSDAGIRDAMPRESTASTIQTGNAPLLMGIEQMHVTNRMTAGKVVIMESGMTGTIADERPEGGEGYVSYDTGNQRSNIFVKVYDEDKTDDRIIRCARWPAMWIAEPKSAYVITGA